MLPVSVILVNYQSPELVVGAVRHLENLDHERPAETIVVDNSTDHELEARLEGRVMYFTPRRNLGFAGGVNAGLAHVTQETVILLNPDARPEPGCLDSLTSVLQENRDVGIAAPQLVPLSPGRVTIPSATRRDPSVLTILAEYTALRRLLPASWLHDTYFLTAARSAAPAAAAMVQGACFAFRRALVDRIGLFDEERFFLYRRRPTSAAELEQPAGESCTVPRPAVATPAAVALRSPKPPAGTSGGVCWPTIASTRERRDPCFCGEPW